MINDDQFVDCRDISAEYAQRIVNAAAGAAQGANKPMAISVVDRAGILKAFVRMDGVSQISVEISQNKAYTSATSGMPSHMWYDIIKDDEPLRLGFLFTRRLVSFGGGFPVVVGGQVIGGLGISGGHYSEDIEIARAALGEVGADVDD